MKPGTRCPACGREQNPRLTCEQCGSPLAVELDYFAAVGLPRLLNIDSRQLENVYHDLGRRIHPDRFATAAAAVRDASLRTTALLTRSYRTLKEPVARGRYWLELHGEKLAEDNKKVPPELAELVFEVQEQIAEARDGATPGLLQALEARGVEVKRAIEAAGRLLQENFERWDNGAAPQALLKELKDVLSEIAYLRTLARDIDRALENQGALRLSS